jgi:L-alanine-DL-glutamate epimerase-like enolase superfamily enzyme
MSFLEPMDWTFLVPSTNVARMAQNAGLPCTPNAANLSLVTICNMHLLAAIPNAGKYLQPSTERDDDYPWNRDLFVVQPFAVTDGHVTVTDTQGWLNRAEFTGG